MSRDKKQKTFEHPAWTAYSQNEVFENIKNKFFFSVNVKYSLQLLALPLHMA
jgi:hypothetical protein